MFTISSEGQVCLCLFQSRSYIADIEQLVVCSGANITADWLKFFHSDTVLDMFITNQHQNKDVL